MHSRATKGRALAVAIALSILLSTMLKAATVIYSQADSRTFPETGHTVKGKFLQYWDSHGGLAQQGYPITEEMQEVSDTDGETYTVQYFERAVFELHPKSASVGRASVSTRRLLIPAEVQYDRCTQPATKRRYSLTAIRPDGAPVRG